MNSEHGKIPVTVVTGYLGSGKTTFMNELLKMQSDKKIAIVVNDMGTINIDASLLRNPSMVNTPDFEMISLQNGCICCTLRETFMDQLKELAEKDMDAILVEASGISDPVSIADAFMEYETETEEPAIYLDSVITVVDGDRIYHEFLDDLKEQAELEEDEEDPDIINLIVDQIEFCSTILLNKVDLLEEHQLEEVRDIIKVLQPQARVLETEYAKVDLQDILSHESYNYDRIRDSSLINKTLFLSHHHGMNEDGIHEEYGISSFVYTEKRPFVYDLFMDFLETYPETIIRAKGYVWFLEDDEHTQLFEQAGRNASVTEISTWTAALPEEEQAYVRAEYPDVAADWDEIYGDRVNQIVFIGKSYDKTEIENRLNACLGQWN